MRCFYIELFVVLTKLLVSTNAEVFSCGGFVHTPNLSINYSKLQVKLLTSEGNLKGEAECSPTNGYYMIPVYNKGDYLIRIFAPEGWFFEPDSHNIRVDGKTDPCSTGEDIDFVLSGFSVQGVLKSGDGAGPTGVVLTLSAENGTMIAETTTTMNGAYQFRAPPGKYLVSTGSDSAECIERGKVPVQVEASPVYVTPDLKISGHLLSVTIVSDSLKMPNISVSLFSTKLVKLPYCASSSTERVLVSENFASNMRHFCTVKTDVEGIARFPCLPPGDYIIQPSAITDQVRFNFSPKVKEITMKSSAVKVAFDTLGFTSGGHVLLNEKPVSGADILLNGVWRTKSNENGWYEIDGLHDKEYTIVAKKEHHSFSTVAVKLSANNAEIPNIIVKKLEICIFVNIEKRVAGILTVMISTKGIGNVEEVHEMDGDKLCIMMPPAVYTISVKSSNGLLITPNEIEVDTMSGPAMNIRFSQFKAEVTVRAKCIGECSASKVELWRNGDQLVKTVDGSNLFVFSDVSPDFYKLKIVDSKRYCWKESEFDIKIERSNVANVVFNQIGHQALLSLTHAASVRWSLLDRPDVSGHFEASHGESMFCVPSTGIYVVKLEECYKFDKQVYEFTVPQIAPLVASAISFKISASVHRQNEDSSASEITLHVKSETFEDNILLSSKSANKFEFEFYLSVIHAGSEFTLTPKSHIHLFTPTKHVFTFNGECHVNLVEFTADKGVFLEGRIIPPLQDVVIWLSHHDSSTLFKVVTEATGNFRIGPLRDTKNLNITAEKNGYKFEKTSEIGVIRAIKLSQLIVRVVDVENNQRLESVLLSLSGVDNYRSNNLIKETGQISFVGLKPGQYFLRPILQEYQFEPKSLTIDIKEGEFQTVVMKGRRFAYSVFGKVSYLAGQPVQLVVVEAVSEQCSQLQEEDNTDENGHYRIRGLHPNCLYRLVLKSSDGQRLLSYPTHYDITVNDDVKEIDFVLTQIDEQVDVAGKVIFVNAESPSQYRIDLCQNGNALQHVQVNAPSTVFYFDIPAIDNLEYSVRFEVLRGAQTQKLNAAEVFFVANETFKAVTIFVEPQRKSEIEIAGGSYFALPFFFLIAIIFFNQQKAILWLELAFARISAFPLPHQAQAITDDYAESIRKRQKAKKN